MHVRVRRAHDERSGLERDAGLVPARVVDLAADGLDELGELLEQLGDRWEHSMREERLRSPSLQMP